MPMRQSETLPWLALKFTPGVGNHLFKRLITRFGNPGNVFNTDSQDLAQVRGMTGESLKGIRARTSFFAAEKELAAINRSGSTIITMGDPSYPVLLKQIPDPPPVLTVRGNVDNDRPCIAVVGSRRATSYGLFSARKLAYDLAGMGFQVVSGLATGIDSAAHAGAIDAGGKTLAVLGNGIATVYPKSNRNLFGTIAKTGAVMSEFPVYSQPEAKNFPIRNRVIAGLCAGCVVVEAALKSGSLITARLSAEYNREIFAVPGSIHSSRSAGTHALIRQGATLVETPKDIIEQLHHLVHWESQTASSDRTAGLNTLDLNVLDLLDPYPRHIDDIIQLSGLDNGSVSAALLDLELRGLVRQSPGKRFSIIEE